MTAREEFVSGVSLLLTKHKQSGLALRANSLIIPSEHQPRENCCPEPVAAQRWRILALSPLHPNPWLSHFATAFGLGRKSCGSNSGKYGTWMSTMSTILGFRLNKNVGDLAHQQGGRLYSHGGGVPCVASHQEVYPPPCTPKTRVHWRRNRL